MESQPPLSRSRIITASIVFGIGLMISFLIVPSKDRLTIADTMKVLTPIFLSGLVYLFFQDIKKFFQEGIALFINHVAKEISKQAGLLPKRKGKPVKKIQTKFVNPMVLDTSAIIDGRIQYILSTNFIFGTFVVPNFILLELQAVADSSSTLKRQRGRRGLEVLEAMRELAKTSQAFSLAVVQDDPKRTKTIDEKLLKVAKQYKAAVVTCDYNLNKVATVQGIRVLNVNELVNAVKTVTIPGETMYVKLIQRGKEREQGVGYLEDGTMVVVEEGQVYLGSEVKITVSRVIQTSAGRMIFGAVGEAAVVLPQTKAAN